jgi:ABC-type antimicrobial peptide transport system permease subunit
MAVSDHPISGGMSAEASVTWAGKDPTQQPLVALNAVSHDLPNVNGFVFVEGRDFSRDLSSDSSALIINQLAAELIAPGRSAIGAKVKWGKNEREVIGVIKDQLRWGPFAKQTPHMYFVRYDDRNFITVRLNKGVATKTALAQVESVIKKYDSGAPFEYTFVDEDFNRQFRTEERIASLATVFAVLAVFISCIGILGLASFAASQRVKEIGVRKILGASIFSIWKMLSKDFVFLVIIAMVIAIPISRYAADQWLQQYDYRVEISWWVFIVTGLGSLAVTLATISYQSVKAAMNNPVNSLRAE